MCRPACRRRARSPGSPARSRSARRARLWPRSGCHGCAARLRPDCPLRLISSRLAPRHSRPINALTRATDGTAMTKVRVASFSVSIDGYGAGAEQSLENPLGVGGLALHEWAFATRTFRKMFGQEGGATGPDDDFAARGFAGVG